MQAIELMDWASVRAPHALELLHDARISSVARGDDNLYFLTTQLFRTHLLDDLDTRHITQLNIHKHLRAGSRKQSASDHTKDEHVIL